MGQDNPLLFPAGIDEKYYQKVLDSTNEGVIRVDDKGIITYANPKFCELFDLTPKQLLGKNLFSFIDKKEIPDQTQKINNRLHGKSESYERTLVGENHQIYRCFITAFPIFAKDGSFIGSFALVKDVTAEKIEFEKFTESQRNFNALAKSLPDVVSRYNRELKIIYINDAIKQISGLDPGEYLGKSNGMLDLPEDQARLWHKALESAFAFKKEISIEFERNTSRGLRYFETRIIPEFSEDGSVQTVFCVTRDFTDQVNVDRKKREEDANWLALLEQADERIHLAAQAAHLGVWEWDILADKLIWDDQMFELYGLKRENFIPVYADWHDAIHPDDVAKSDIEMKRALEDRVPYDTEFRVILPDHKIRWMRALGQVFSNSSGQPARMIGVNFDTTEQKWVENANRLLVEAQPQMDQAKSAEEIYHIVSQKIQPIIETGVSVVTRMDESGLGESVVDVLGFGNRLQEVIRLFNIDFEKMVFYTKDITEEELARFSSGKLELYPGEFYELVCQKLHRKMPKRFFRWVEKEFKINHIYNMGFKWEDTFFGGVTLFTSRDLAPVSTVISSLVNQAALSLTKIHSEQQLRESEQRFRSLFDDSPIALWEEDFSAVKARLDTLRSQGVTDFRTFFMDHPQEVTDCARLIKIIDVNRAAVRLLRAKSKNEIYKNINLILGKQDNLSLASELVQIANGKSNFEWEGINHTVDGRPLTLNLQWSAAPGYEETLARVIVSIVDVTERRQAEDQLRENERQISTLMSNLPGMVYRCLNDKNWTMEFVSEGSLILTGYSPDDFVKNQIHYNDIILAEDREMVWKEIQIAEKENQPFQLAYRIRTKTDKIKWVWEQGRKVYSETNRALLEGFITDITERKLAEQSLLAMSEVQRQIVLLHTPQEIIHLVGQRICKLLGDALVGVTILDEKEQAMHMIGHYGFGDLYDKLAAQFNFDPSTVPFYLKKFTAEELELYRSGKLKKYDNGLYNLLSGKIQKSACRVIEKQLRIKDIYVIGFIHGGIHFGSLVILARSTIDPFVEPIETIVNQATILLDRISSEDALRESEDRFHRIFDESPIGIFIADIQGHYINTNKMASAILGYSQNELLRLTLKQGTFPDDYAENERLRDQLIRGEIQLFHLTKRYIHKEGRIIWAELTVTAVHSQTGEIIGTLAMVEDITEKKRSAEALEYEQYLLQTLMENLPDSVFYKDLENRFIRVNPATVTKFGASTVDEILGKTDADFLSPEATKGWAGEENEIVRTGNPVIYSNEMEVWKDNRPTTWCSSTKMPLRDKEGNIIGSFGISHDITRLMEDEEKIKQLNADLEKKVESRTNELILRNQELEAFTYSISHDLKAPLRGITGYSELLLQEHSRQLDEEGKAFLNKLMLSSQQLSQLIDDLLEYTRLERNPLNSQPLSVYEIVKPVIEERISDIRSGHILIHENIEGEMINSSPDLLTRIFRNYLDNAMKFTEKTDHPEIWIDYKNLGVTSLFSIRDNGVGFDMKYSEKIFDVFYRLHPVDEFTGTGIGLALVKKAAGLLGYRVWAVSEVNAGATFFLEINKSPSAG
jgi:PAS domain S-box-containing protein